MNFHVMTLFPEMIERAMGESITGRAIKAGHISVNAVNIRDFTKNKPGKVDDYPYGGGAGMVMQAQPIYDAWKSIVDQVGYQPRCIYLTPQGRVFEQGMAKEYAREEELIFLCGHYEGVDQRALDGFVDDEISIGDYVLTGGELPAMVVTDAICRYIDGVLDGESLIDESFTDNLLEYPQYTRPAEFNGEKVPDVLISGNHKLVDEWRVKRAEELTKEKRPDLYRKYARAKARAEEKKRLEKERQRQERRAKLKAEKQAENVKKCAGETPTDDGGSQD